MKLDIKNKDNASAGSATLPAQFKEPVRADLIKKAVLTIQANKRQSYGAYEEAGKRSSSFVSKRRHDFKGTYGIGQSRTPRKTMSVRGTRFNWEGAFAPQTVGGRRAHPPKAEKIHARKINSKERHKAIRSALAATLDKELVALRGHIVPSNYPFIISNDFESLSKTKEIKGALSKLGLADELARADVKKVRAGKGTMRGRKYKTKTSVLIVTGEHCALSESADNLPGVDTVTIENINVELLAPGTQAGRLTLYTQSALEKLEKNALFTDKRVKANEETQEKQIIAKKAVVKKTTKKAVVKKTVVKAEHRVPKADKVSA